MLIALPRGFLLKGTPACGCPAPSSAGPAPAGACICPVPAPQLHAAPQEHGKGVPATSDTGHSRCLEKSPQKGRVERCVPQITRSQQFTPQGPPEMDTSLHLTIFECFFLCDCVPPRLLCVHSALQQGIWCPGARKCCSHPEERGAPGQCTHPLLPPPGKKHAKWPG